MKLLVTGGAGFIGTNFIKYITSNSTYSDFQITVLDNLTYAGNYDNIVREIETSKINFIKGDICDYDLMTDLIKKSDAIVNFAAESHVDNSIKDGTRFIDSNSVGVSNILEILKHNSDIRLVQISTDEVYGSISNGSWDETCKLDPKSPYSASKASADLLVGAYCNTFKIDAVITRCSNNYGPYQHPEKLVPKIILRIINGEKIPIYGDGSNIREWIHVSDHVKAITKVLLKGEASKIYNISGNKEISNLDLVLFILEQFGANSSLIEFVSDRPGHDKRYALDDGFIKDSLEFAPEMNFEDGIKDTIDWYQKNRNWIQKAQF